MGTVARVPSIFSFSPLSDPSPSGESSQQDQQPPATSSSKAASIEEATSKLAYGSDNGDVEIPKKKRRKKSEVDAAVEAGGEKKRQGQSCDACRSRKVKCDKLTLLNAGETIRTVPLGRSDRCGNCVTLGIDCVFSYTRKKRGPPVQYLQRLEQERAVAQTLASMDTSGSFNMHQSVSPVNYSAPMPTSSSSAPPFALPNNSATTNVLSSVYSIPRSTEPLTAGAGGVLPKVIAKGTFPKMYKIEDVLPREKAIYFLSLFFDFIYPLTPTLHRPSIFADLESRRETRDPLFFALIMSTLAMTLLQVPTAFTEMDRAEVVRLAEACHWASRDASIRQYQPLRVQLVIVRYFDCIYHTVAGNPVVNHASFAEALDLSLTMRLHDEKSYIELDPIEAETRRRTFYLIYNSDKSRCIIGDRPLCIRAEDVSVNYPRELDDSLITATGYLETLATVPSRTSLITGFNTCSRVFSALEEIMTLQRRNRKYPPIGIENILPKLDGVRLLYVQLMALISNLPTAYQIQNGFDSVANSPEAGWASAAKDSLELLFHDPSASRVEAKDAFAVSKSNIHVTQIMVRFVLMQYRDDLLKLCGEKDSADRRAGEAIAGNLDDHHKISSDLLNVLHNIPIQCIAVNGPSLVNKVRFVASSLLDDPEYDDESSTNAVRFASFLYDFLTILSDIEKHFAVL